MRAACSTFMVAAALVGIACPRPASAQTIPSPYAFVEERQEISGFVGYMSASTGTFGFGPKGGIMYGARYGLDLSGPLSLEAMAGVVDGRRDVVSPSRPEGDRVIGEAETLLTVFDARLRLSATGARTWRGLTPFLLFGAGVAFDRGKASAADALLDTDEVFDFGTKFVAVAGPGVRWSISRSLAVRADATLTLWKITTPAGYGDQSLGLGSVAESEWANGLSFSAAVLFRW
jgi:hypothetical protein